jgi:hypothetical protein
MTINAVVSQVIEVLVSQRRPKGLELVAFDPELKPERVQAWLAANPAWILTRSGKMLERARIFPSGMAAGHFASFVSGLASSMAVPALLKVRGETVHISLFSPRSRGKALLTENVLSLASQIG